VTALATIKGFFAIPPGTEAKPNVLIVRTADLLDRASCKPRRKGEIGKLSRLPISIAT
jgi:hypothetical protein